MFLVIQTSFTGDVIAATAVIEKLHQKYPLTVIDVLVRQGNESLFAAHPFIRKVRVWEKKKNKIYNLLKLIFEIRKVKYDVVINLHRFASTGFITAFSKAKDTRGFNKNPLSLFFKKRFPHHLGDGTTEYERNQLLIADLTDDLPAAPKFYPAVTDYELVSTLKPKTQKVYYCIAPSSVWFTKQLPAEKWINLIRRIPDECTVYLLGSEEDRENAELIRSKSNHPKVVNLSGKLSLLQSAALMSDSKMNFVNDSAPLHLCSAMNAPVTAFFLSTTTRFGFVPVSDESVIIETHHDLDCRPCGSHGFTKCPKGHFKCALTIDIDEVKII